VLLEMPVSAATVRTLQWVALGGRRWSHLAHQRRHLLIAITARSSRTQFPLQPGHSAFAPAARQWLMVGTLTPQRAARSDWIRLQPTSA